MKPIITKKTIIHVVLVKKTKHVVEIITQLVKPARVPLQCLALFVLVLNIG
jgi:hypothetical protein